MMEVCPISVWALVLSSHGREIERLLRGHTGVCFRGEWKESAIRREHREVDQGWSQGEEVEALKSKWLCWISKRTMIMIASSIFLTVPFWCISHCKLFINGYVANWMLFLHSWSISASALQSRSEQDPASRDSQRMRRRTEAAFGRWVPKNKVLIIKVIKMLLCQISVKRNTHPCDQSVLLSVGFLKYKIF